MDLILWRHADAGDSIENDWTRDMQRRLTSKGEKQAARMAEWLNRLLSDNTRVLVSPAQRCQQTALALGRRFRTSEALGPGGTVGDLLTLARWPRRHEPVLVVGHQPTLGLTAATLMSGVAMLSGAASDAAVGSTAAWSVRKGAVWWLRHRERDGVGEVVLVLVNSPQTL